jgi:hypothetical protein
MSSITNKFLKKLKEDFESNEFNEMLLNPLYKNIYDKIFPYYASLCTCIIIIIFLLLYILYELKKQANNKNIISV